MSEKKSYVVTSPGTLNHAVGDTIELTDQQAANLVNKIRLKDDIDLEAAKAGRKSNLEKEHGELTARVAELTAQNKALLIENQQLKAAR